MDNLNESPWSQSALDDIFSKVKQKVPEQTAFELPKFKLHAKVFLIGTEPNVEYEKVLDKIATGKSIQRWEHVFDCDGDKVKIALQWADVIEEDKETKKTVVDQVNSMEAFGKVEHNPPK